MSAAAESQSEPTPSARLASISLDTRDPAALADFYGALLGLERVFQTSDGHVIALADRSSADTAGSGGTGGIALTMMYAADHEPPTWPGPGRQQQLHLDLAVDDLEAAVARAIALGARPSDHQAAPQLWRVLIDPAGHPFCLTTVTGA